MVWLLTQCLVRSGEIFHLYHILIALQPSQTWLKVPRNWENRTSAIPHTRNCDHLEKRLQRSGFFLFWPIKAKLVASSICLIISEASATFMSMSSIFNL